MLFDACSGVWASKSWPWWLQVFATFLRVRPTTHDYNHSHDHNWPQPTVKRWVHLGLGLMPAWARHLHVASAAFSLHRYWTPELWRAVESCGRMGGFRPILGAVAGVFLSPVQCSQLCLSNAKNSSSIRLSILCDCFPCSPVRFPRPLFLLRSFILLFWCFRFGFVFRPAFRVKRIS